jgi:DNA transformation protein
MGQEGGDHDVSDLTELPNIGRALADRLAAIGVSGPEVLAALGSVEATIRLGAATGRGCTNTLYALAGAIRGVRWHALPQQVRQRLKAELDRSVGE